MKQIITYRSKVVIGLAALALTVGFGAGVASAASPHFISADADVNSAGDLVCTFKEAGLGNTLSTAQITCEAQGSATYFCINKGGNHPQAGNKETVTGLVSATGTFPVRNGQTTGTLTVDAPGPGDFACPGGQTLFLVEASYTSIALSGEGATANVQNVSSGCLLTGKLAALCP
jgi:hypothetical protein